MTLDLGSPPRAMFFWDASLVVMVSVCSALGDPGLSIGLNAMVRWAPVLMF